MKKAAIYDPYLDALGGGERYVFTLANCLLKDNWQVDIFWNDKNSDFRAEAKKRFGLNLESVGWVNDVFKSNYSPLSKWRATHGYDLLFYLSDGSIPFLFSKKNILHFQIPFHHRAKTLMNKIKLSKINAVVNNSFFTKRFTDAAYGVDGKVLYPPVAVGEFLPGKKENIILNVGRFTKTLHDKSQSTLLETFRLLVKDGLKGWRLILTGGSKGSGGLVDGLKRKAVGLPVEIRTDVSFAEVKDFYAKAKIFWTAAGFGINEGENPEKVEHFGIALVEAMAAGCVSFAVGKGGHKEIIEDGENGYFWQSVEDLKTSTLALMKNNQKAKEIISKARKRAELFSEARFCAEVQRMANE